MRQVRLLSSCNGKEKIAAHLRCEIAENAKNAMHSSKFERVKPVFQTSPVHRRCRQTVKCGIIEGSIFAIGCILDAFTISKILAESLLRLGGA